MDILNIVIMIICLVGGFFFWCVWGFLKYKGQEKCYKKEIGGYLLEGTPLKYAVQKAFEGVNNRFQLKLNSNTINAVAQRIAGLTNIMSEENAIEIYSFFINRYIFQSGMNSRPKGITDEQVLYAVENMRFNERNRYFVIASDSSDDDFSKKYPWKVKNLSISERYENLPEWLRWVLILPLGTFFSLIVIFLISLIRLDYFFVYPAFGMISFIYALHVLAPRFKNRLICIVIILRMIISVVIVSIIIMAGESPDRQTWIEMCRELFTWAVSWYCYFGILRKVK